jgi:cobalt/nickel transport system permease protein
MSHLHIPDGVLPVWLWLAGLLLMILFLAIALRAIRKADLRRRLPLLAFTAAMMLISMSLEIVPIAYHLNLSVLTGILLGPAMGFVAAFLVNFMLALVGHGGLTVVGLNSLVIGLETFCGYWLFHFFNRLFKPALAGGLSVVLTLFLSTSLVVGLVALSRLSPAEVGELAETGHPSEKGLFSFHGGHHHEDRHEAESAKPAISLSTFAKGAYILGSIGWILEALLVGFILRFIAQVKPEMIST